MRAYAARLLGSNSESDDAVQDAFIAAWDRLPSLEDPGSVRSWLMRIVSRKCFDRIRARHETVELAEWAEAAPVSGSPEHQAEVSSQLDAVAATLASLPALQRECWTLREVGEYSYQEIADELAISTATVRGALARARQTLLRSMEGWQ